MKADSIVKRNLARVSRLRQSHPDLVVRRVAWAIEHAVRWAREDVRGWPDLRTVALDTSRLIHEDAERRRA